MRAVFRAVLNQMDDLQKAEFCIRGASDLLCRLSQLVDRLCLLPSLFLGYKQNTSARRASLFRLKRLLGAVMVILGLWIYQPGADANTVLPDRVPLTLEVLQSRLKAPTQSEGVRTIDLRRFIIDLRPDNAAFRDQFYRLIRAQLQRSTVPMGLDLSYSLIQGDFKFGELGIRMPLYGQSMPPIFSETEQAQFMRDRLRLSQLSQLSRSLLVQSQPTYLQITILQGPLTLFQTQFEGFGNFANAYFLGRVEAQGAIFTQDTDWSEARFSRPASFSDAIFRREARFRSALFFERVRFNASQFQGAVNFQSSEFRATASFHRALFQQGANLTRIQWRDNADFAQTQWQRDVFFDRDQFNKSLFLTEAVFEKLLSFRQTQFNQSVNLRGAAVLEQIDFGDAAFEANAYLNVPGLQFDPKKATILGNPGQVGRVISVPTLQGNEALLGKLVQNFRLQQQISDANQVEYTTERLRAQQLRSRFLSTNLNTANTRQLLSLGLSVEQVRAVLRARTEQPFRSLNDLLKLPEIDFSTYVKVRDRVIAGQPLSVIGRISSGLHWVGLNLLLLLTRYGTSFGLAFGVGLIALAHFAVLFWVVDRVRRLYPKPILPTSEEMIWVLSGFSTLTLIGLSTIFRTADRPWLTLLCLELIIVPIPGLLLGLTYWQGRYHDLMNVSYFVEDSSMRQLRVLIGRLPVIPLFPLFRDRYTAIPWERRWNWLNYFDFSFNNWLRFGFNDIRLRDQHVPGLITALAWYQWSLGLIYAGLVVWTLSRTIPGVNLLIYFK